MSEEKRCCENCGNTICADSIIAIFWDDCVRSNFTRNWRPVRKEETDNDGSRKRENQGSQD